MMMISQYAASMKRRFSKLPHKPNPRSVAVAADESFSEEQVIHTEDLTASQFADMIGIKTKKRDTASVEICYSIYSGSESEDSLSTTDSTMTIWDTEYWELGHKRSHSVPTNFTQPNGTIQKGRFQIVWGQQQQQQQQHKQCSTVTSISNCVEWKRKRSPSLRSSV